MLEPTPTGAEPWMLARRFLADPAPGALWSHRRSAWYFSEIDCQLTFPGINTSGTRNVSKPTVRSPKKSAPPNTVRPFCRGCSCAENAIAGCAFDTGETVGSTYTGAVAC